MGFACDFEGAGFVLKLPVLIILHMGTASVPKNGPAVIREIVPLLGGRAACGGGGNVVQ